MGEIEIFKNDDMGVQARIIRNGDGSISINAEDAAIGFGWTQTEVKNGKKYTTIRWARMNNFCKEFGFDHGWSKDDYIPESLFYMLGMKASNENALKFQKWLAIDVIPSLRKTGKYEMPNRPKTSDVKVDAHKRSELLLKAAELRANPMADQRLVDLAVCDLTGEPAPVRPTPPVRPKWAPDTQVPIVRPPMTPTDLYDLPEVIGYVKNAGFKCRGISMVKLYTVFEIANMAGTSAAEFDAFANAHRLKTDFNGEWTRIVTTEGPAREFLYTLDAVEIYRNEVR